MSQNTASAWHFSNTVLGDVVHDTEQYADNRVGTDHSRLEARLGPMRGLKRDRTASIVIRGHAFILNLRRDDSPRPESHRAVR